ncbi:MAG: cupin domain-containing protein [Steroidobacteraceae bacterium]
MKLPSVLVAMIVSAVAVLAPFVSQAIEPSAVVKVKEVLKTSTTWNGAPIKYPEGKPEITGLIIEVAPGGETSWHEHPFPSVGMVLEGTLEVTLTDGKKKLIKSGEALAEVINTAHNGRNIGTGPLKLLVFYSGAVGKPLTIPRPDVKPKTN